MIGLVDSCDVYTAAVDTGAFTVQAKSGLACRLCHLDQSAHDAADDRAEGVRRRMLMYDRSYAMPAHCQVEIAGQRWSVVEGTADGRRGPMGTVVFNRCEVVEA